MKYFIFKVFIVWFIFVATYIGLFMINEYRHKRSQLKSKFDYEYKHPKNYKERKR